MSGLAAWVGVTLWVGQVPASEAPATAASALAESEPVESGAEVESETDPMAPAESVEDPAGDGFGEVSTEVGEAADAVRGGAGTLETKDAIDVGAPASETLLPAGRQPEPGRAPGEADDAGLDGDEAAARPAVAPVLLTRPWSIGTARTLPPGRTEVGVFQPLRYGLTDDTELSIFPVWAVLMPNLAIKKAWWRSGDWQMATRHGLSYPSGLLKVLAREGTGGILPHETYVPHLVAMSNEVLFSRSFWGAEVVTAKAGLLVGAGMGRSTLESIDVPIVYPRTAAYQNYVTGLLGVDVDGELPGPFAFFVDLDVFLMPDRHAPFAVEHSGMAIWRATSHFVVALGYKVVFGAYPDWPGFRTQWHVLPLADVQWAFD